MGGRNTPRHTAVEILRRWENSGRSLGVIRDRMFKRFPLADSRDRAQVNMLIFGLMRKLNLVDFFISRRANRPLTKLDHMVLAALRIGVFELHGPGKGRGGVVVNETVNAIRAAGAPRWQIGFVNAVLRRFVAEGFADVPRSEALRLGHPGWMLDRWRNQWGRLLAEKIAAENNRQPDICLRARPGRGEGLIKKIRAAGIRAEPGAVAPDAVRLPEFSGRIEKLPAYDHGGFVVQDEAAQLVSRMAVAGIGRGGMKILDGCAGVGGKSCHLADLSDETTKIVALEPEVSRRELLAVNIKRLGLGGRVEIRNGRIGDPAEEDGRLFNLVLIDAPCSGLGVIRRHPDIRWNRQEREITESAARQKDLLRQAAGLVAPGGRLVYAVCSFEPEETVAVVEDFLARQPDFVVEAAESLLPATAAPCLREGFFLSLPGEFGMDGFFCAAMVRG